jgi:hypothetical protein
MNGTSQRATSLVGILGAFLILGVLVFAMKSYIKPAPINQARIEERKKALVEIRAEADKALNNYDVLDPGKGLVRLRIERAMELTLEDYKNPGAARSNLIARAEKASAAPPKPPEAPGKFE